MWLQKLKQSLLFKFIIHLIKFTSLFQSFQTQNCFVKKNIFNWHFYTVTLFSKVTVQNKTIYYKHVKFAKKELIKEEVITTVSKARFPCCTAGGGVCVIL